MYVQKNKSTPIEKIDFNKVLWEAVKHMNDSMFQGDMVLFANSLQSLEILLVPKIAISKFYEKEYKKNEEKYKKDMEIAGNDDKKKKLVMYNKYIVWAKLLMNLIHEAGYLPEEHGQYGRKYDDEDEESDEI